MQIPVTRREVVPEKITTTVPVTTQRFAEDEYISRVAVSAKPQTATGVGPSSDPFGGNDHSGVAGREAVGGVRRLDSDPPRDGDWHPAESIRR